MVHARAVSGSPKPRSISGSLSPWAGSRVARMPSTGFVARLTRILPTAWRPSYLYALVFGVLQDSRKPWKLARKAAKEQSASQAISGSSTPKGEGSARDPTEAVRLLRKIGAEVILRVSRTGSHV